MSYIKHILKKCTRRNQYVFRRYAIAPRVLDLGGGERHLGELLNDDVYDVTLIDVYDANQTDLPYVVYVYNSRDLPFCDDAFDTTIILLVLHHCDDDKRGLQEAIRVTPCRLLVAESVYRTRFGRWMLWTVDTLFNGVRSGRAMPRALHFKRAEQWRRIFSEQDLITVEEIDLSRGIHCHALFVLDCPCSKTEVAVSPVGSTHALAGSSVDDKLNPN